jgi:hypothetical protein
MSASVQPAGREPGGGDGDGETEADGDGEGEGEGDGLGEDEFDIEVPYINFKRCKTLGEAADYVVELLEE